MGGLIRNPIVVYIARKLSTSPEFLEETKDSYAMVRGEDVMGDSSMRFTIVTLDMLYFSHLPLFSRDRDNKIILTIFHRDTTISLVFSYNEDPESIWSWVESHIFVPKIRGRLIQGYKSIADYFDKIDHGCYKTFNIGGDITLFYLPDPNSIFWTDNIFMHIGDDTLLPKEITRTLRISMGVSGDIRLFNERDEEVFLKGLETIK